MIHKIFYILRINIIFRYPPDSRTNAKEETEYYDLSVNRNGNPVAAPRTITVNRTGKSTSSSADYQVCFYDTNNKYTS